MPPSERLAAYLADELSPDERRALEAQLAGDAQLRAQLAAMRRADAALADLPATELPAGARERLLAALAPTLDEQLGAATDDGREGGDELAARRARRRTWLSAVGGVAAAAVAVAVVVPSLSGGDDAADRTVTTLDSGSDHLAGQDDAAGGAEGGAALPTAPTVTAGDRVFDGDDVDQLLAAGELEAIASAGLERTDAAELGAAWAAALGATSGPGVAAGDGSVGEAEVAEETQETADGGGTADEDAAGDTTRDTAEDATGAAPAPRADTTALIGPGVDEAARADVARCLDELLATGDLVVPVTAVLIVFDGDPAVAFGLVGADADGEMTRRELWVLARDGCDVRYFGQSPG